MPSVSHKSATNYHGYHNVPVKLGSIYKKPKYGYTLITDNFLEIETWTSQREEAERIEVFENFIWFPITDYACEYCGDMVDFPEVNFQYGFAFQPDDYDRIRILCSKCVED